jgi:lysophospholipase L1-like esterase
LSAGWTGFPPSGQKTQALSTATGGDDMDSDYPAEAADPYCLRSGEAAALLAGHGWRRFAVLGDSIAEGLGDPLPGYPPLPFADRVRAELAASRPDLAYLNLGRRGLRTREVRAGQLATALDFGPDLALLACGANDAMRPGYETRADAVDADLTAMVSALSGAGALVVTVGIFVLPGYPGLPEWLAPAFRRRMALLARRTAAVAATLGALHVDLAAHPATAGDALTGADGLHGNGRGQAIAAAQTVRVLGAYLGNRYVPSI